MNFLKVVGIYFFIWMFFGLAPVSAEEIRMDQPYLKGEVIELKGFEKFKQFIKGEPAHDQLNFGMWSKHASSSKNYQENNNIIGGQYKGIWASRFVNSHNRDVIAIAIARTVKKKRLSEDLLFDVGYKVGPMFGYKEGAPNIDGFSILPFVCVGLSYKDFGLSLNFIPAAAVSVYTYVNLDMFRKKREGIDWSPNI